MRFLFLRFKFTFYTLIIFINSCQQCNSLNASVSESSTSSQKYSASTVVSSVRGSAQNDESNSTSHSNEAHSEPNKHVTDSVKPLSIVQKASSDIANKLPPLHQSDVKSKHTYHTRFTAAELSYLLGDKSELDDEGSLPYIPPDITNVTQLRQYTVNRSHDIKNVTITPELETNLKLTHLTDTYLSCYIAPPAKTFINMFDLMGFWYMVRKVNNDNLTDENYVCEEIIYTPTGYNTFNKVSDVHFRHKWLTIHGNGTFISPGIVIIDWKVLSSPSKPSRLVYTVLGTDYDHWLVGYDCRTGDKKPEIALQTRRQKVPVKYLEQAYGLIKDEGLPLHDLVCQAGF